MGGEGVLPLEGASPEEEASEEEGSRWIWDMFGIHQVDLWETAGGRDGSGARRTLRFLAELEAWHPRRERNTVSAQILRRNHKSPPKVLSPELFGK